MEVERELGNKKEEENPVESGRVLDTRQSQEGDQDRGGKMSSTKDEGRRKGKEWKKEDGERKDTDNGELLS